ncbi:GNA-3 g protein alpha subunit GNA-3 [Apiospora arundinis]|uniref:GNA-3 g protein alpha subunit GNA-3 n=1 Tax=Apiospora arundinis TaxID=335852 RepID=A0ABR2JGR3_9PEZI
MDPLTILTTASTLSSMLNALDRTIANTTEVRGQWQDADLTVLLLENQLATLRTALGQIKDWIDGFSSSPVGFPELHSQLVMDLDRCLICCRLLIANVDSDVSQIHQGTVGKNMPNKFARLMRVRNLKKSQPMIQQQTTALMFLLGAFNSAAISQQKELLDQPQTKRALQAIEEDTSALFAPRYSDPSIMSSSPSSSTMVTSPGFPNTPRPSLKSDFSNGPVVSRIYETWIQNSTEAAPPYQPPTDPNWQQPLADVKEHPVQNGESSAIAANTNGVAGNGARYSGTLSPRLNGSNFVAETIPEQVEVEPNDKFIHFPPEDEGKIVVEPVETQEKFITSPTASPENTNEKYYVNGGTPVSLESNDKFPDDASESPFTPTSSRPGSWLAPARSNSVMSAKSKWKLLRKRREKSEDQKRSLAIDSALKEDYRKERQQQQYKALLFGSDSRLHILTAAKMLDKSKSYTSQELYDYRIMILKLVRKFTHKLIREMRQQQVNTHARYLWAYVEVLESYYTGGINDIDTGLPDELDERFYSALENILQDPHIASMVKPSPSATLAKELKDLSWPRAAEYFFSSLRRITMPDYVPTGMDIIYATTFASTTGGITKTDIRERELGVDFLDIGGLTGKWKKWIHQFEEARFVVFVVDLEEYDKPDVMRDTMELLNAVVNSQWFAAASIILLLNVPPLWTVRNTANPRDNVNIPKAADEVLKGFQARNLERLFISPCSMTVDGGGEAAMQYILSAVKEAILIKALTTVDDTTS